MSAFVLDGHRFPRQPERWTARAGPLDGDWLVWRCLDCNAGLLAPEAGGDAVALLLAALTEAGCGPREVA